jgi:Cysteine rich repeat
MKRITIGALSALVAISIAPQAFGWGAYHGGWGGGAYHGAWGGGAWHSGAFGTTGVHYGPSGATAYHSGAYGTSAYHTGAYHSGTYGAYGGGYYGGGAYYHGGTYYGGTAVVTPAYTGWGAVAAGAAVGAAATSAAYAAATTNYYPPPYYKPYALLSASGAMAQTRPGAQAVLTECKPDIARFCSQVAPGQDRIKTCMKEHLRELSEPCKEGLFQAWLRQ